ncbi:hypothetical protein FRX31_033829, partial [Thalictrum thalictroides]
KNHKSSNKQTNSLLRGAEEEYYKLSNSTFGIREKMVDYADINSSPKQEDEVESAPQMRILALEFSSGASCSKPIGECLASSSQNGLKQYFIEMGFLPNHVDKVFEDHGEENFELLLQALIAYSVVNISFGSIIYGMLLASPALAFEKLACRGTEVIRSVRGLPFMSLILL